MTRACSIILTGEIKTNIFISFRIFYNMHEKVNQFVTSL